MIPTLEDLFSGNGLDDLIFVNKLNSDEIDLIETAFKNYGRLIIDECAENFEFELVDNNDMSENDQQCYTDLEKKVGFHCIPMTSSILKVKNQII